MPDVEYPDCIIRLASAVYVLPCPLIHKPMDFSFTESFNTATRDHVKSAALMRSADTSRRKLADALENLRSVSPSVTGSKHQNAIMYAKEYYPQINQILFSCKVQPEMAVLNKKIDFQWTSGVEITKTVKSNDALMFDLVMSISSLGLGHAGSATDESVAGNFPPAAKAFNVAAGIMSFLHNDLLPKWVSVGSDMEISQLPMEAVGICCDALHILFLAYAQQMAIGTALMKPETINFSLISKLCFGVSTQLNEFVEKMRTHAAQQYARLNPNLIVFITFQINFQESLTNYFFARLVWSKGKYGVAIAILQKAVSLAETRRSATSKGLPDPSDPKSSVKAVENDVKDYRNHLQKLLGEWEKDNRLVYFEKVPTQLKPEESISKGIVMKKPETFTLEDPVPVQLGPQVKTVMTAPPVQAPVQAPPLYPPPVMPPMGNDMPPPAYVAPVQFQRTDSDLAREMQAKFDMGK